MKKAVPKNFEIFKGKHLGWSLFLKKVQVFRAATLLKKRLHHRYFLVKFAKSLKTPCSEKHFQTVAFEGPQTCFMPLVSFYTP